MLLAALVILGSGSFVFSQKVGLVMSGGGAAGLAHLGVIKALEEHNIPIDYITGTSMGAIIGGFYAAGYSVEEITEFAKSEDFLLALEGSLPEKDVYYFTHDPEDASMVRPKISPKRLLTKSIPTNVVTPDLMEYLLMNLLAPPSAAAGYDFDNLMIPFRCLAADIVKKKEVVFKNGSLALAIRASSTYPFYYKPMVLDSTILFDGGLYNNFPADIMYDEFLPDVIIGSNVATSIDPPEEDDLLSLVRNMIMSQSDFSLKCEYGLIIEPKPNVGVFEFQNIDLLVEIGYQAALDRIYELQELAGKRERTGMELDDMRRTFRANFPEKLVGKIDIKGDLSPRQRGYVSSTFGLLAKDSSSFTFDEFKPQFLRAAQDGKVKYIQPVAMYDSSLGVYDINLSVRKEKDLTLLFGGNFSSRPINMGYVGLKYNIFNRTSATLMANSYFGKFYGSVSASANIDFGGKRRISFTPHATLNRWDYFRSFATFFELSRPSYIVKNETFGGVDVAASWGNNTVLKTHLDYGETADQYYQTENFTALDTTDVTNFELGILSVGVDRNTLNRKLYANQGTRLQVFVSGVTGREETTVGNTGVDREQMSNHHTWFQAKLKYQNYFTQIGSVTLGFDAEALYSNKPFFANYTASLISAPAYQPTPESKTIFIDEYRATEYLAFGLRSVFEIRRNIEFRLDGYVLQPGKAIVRKENNEAAFGKAFVDQYYVGATALVWHSPLGPVSLNLNYYDNREDGGPWSFFFNFGYTIFNRSVYEL